jgi:hypothetical protein
VYSRVLQGCYKDVARMLQDNYLADNSARGYTQLLSKNVTSVLQRYYKGVTRMPQGCYLADDATRG